MFAVTEKLSALDNSKRSAHPAHSRTFGGRVIMIVRTASLRLRSAAAALIATAVTVAAPSQAAVAQDHASSISPMGRVGGLGDSGASGTGFGPCPCQPRKTLLQWSYGTSFSGGPDLDEPIVTDRPDFTEASSTVGRGVAQLELGYTYSYDDAAGTTTKSHSYPEPLLRYGIFADWLEMRVAWNYADEESAGMSASGSEDLLLGFKVGLTPQEGILPEMAIIPQLRVPTGASAFTADETLPGFNWVYSWDISDLISTAGSTQFNRATDDSTSEAYTEWAQSWTVGYSLAERAGAYTEWFAFFPHSADSAQPEHYFNGGFTYLLSDDVQWDIRSGIGLNDAADDYFVGTGLAIRFR
ncbi:transporter [Candidatus Laterigemmans baculatus]|uniref:transporter n=1 Tax=Candidatus Laterigemmans baculatus TaxID=2770505 RepID=UPI0013DD4CBB|nr:transporter [Candidatus Laterigemmans baculatus]